MLTKHGSSKLRFPLWQFLIQLLFDSTSKTVLNPCLFWHNYKIQLLERCWNYEVIQLLEDCWQKEVEPELLTQSSVQN
ncbi:MAG TPA: hypothetical protein DCE56_35475 [Cyanobacteria bacterium UBA8553]|nr:hypothetical protein [Cyanobacteria bacterium UBA8553]HAJ61824.1 hypothetical protein [Cyanobacteria bacterium UBA8543]